MYLPMFHQFSGMPLDLEKSPLLRALSANRRPSQFLDVTPVNEGDIADKLHGDANIAEVKSFLKDCGFSEEFGPDPRLEPIFAELKQSADSECLSCFELTDLKRNHLLVQKALSGELAISDFKAFTDIVGRIYGECRNLDGGVVASYIPQLAEVDSSLFGVSVCTVDGQRFNIGDSSQVFSVQSVSKVFSYAIALETRGGGVVHTHVGMEPSGRNFNERVLLPSGIPHNPLINTGAIMVASLLYPNEPRWQRYQRIADYYKRLTGECPSLMHATFLAERETANRNFCLAHMMAETGRFPQDIKSIQTVLDEYFGYCSLGVTTEMMAQAAATLANGGLNPITDDRVFSTETVASVLSTMMTCGMYDASGEFSATNGFPAKSGVSGIIMSVIPGVAGICTFGPKIDSLGNSVRGLEFFAKLARQAVSTPLYNTPLALQTSFGNQFEWRTSGEDTVLSKFTVREFSSLWWAAFTGDELRIRQLAARGIDVNEANYSNRTALNFAVSGGHLPSVQLLVSLGASLNDPELFDSYIQDAVRFNRLDIASYLENCRCESQDSWIDSVDQVLKLSRIPLYRFFAGSYSVSLKEALANCGIKYTGKERLGKTEVRALCGKLIIPDWQRFVSHVDSSCPPGLEIALSSIDSQQYSNAKSESLVALDGLARVLLYELALADLGTHQIHQFVGREPSGQSETALRMNADGLPYNSLTMSGCLTVCEQLLVSKSPNEIYDWVRARLGSTCSSKIPSIVDDDRYMDLIECTRFWLSSQNLPVRRESVEVFVKCHRLVASLTDIAQYAQSLACSYSPLLALLFTCGLDEHSGEWSFRNGIPARTSLRGIIMGVVPGVLGYAVRSSTEINIFPSDIADFQSKFGEGINFHMFRRHAGSRIDPTLYFWSNQRLEVTKFLSAAFHGDLSSMKHMVAEGLDVNSADMDGRTALHIAKAVGNFVIAEWLQSKGADCSIKDSWGYTPLLQ